RAGVTGMRLPDELHTTTDLWAVVIGPDGHIHRPGDWAKNPHHSTTDTDAVLDPPRSRHFGMYQTIRDTAALQATHTWAQRRLEYNERRRSRYQQITPEMAGLVTRAPITEE